MPFWASTLWKTTWRALYAWPSGPATVSALAMLLATAFRRWLCALTALPLMWKMLNIDMTISCPARSGGVRRLHRVQHRADAAVEEAQRRFVLDGVVGEAGALAVHVDGVAVHAGHGAQTALQRVLGALGQGLVGVRGRGGGGGLAQRLGEIHG